MKILNKIMILSIWNSYFKKLNSMNPFKRFAFIIFFLFVAVVFSAVIAALGQFVFEIYLLVL